MNSSSDSLPVQGIDARIEPLPPLVPLHRADVEQQGSTIGSQRNDSRRQFGLSKFSSLKSDSLSSAKPIQQVNPITVSSSSTSDYFYLEKDLEIIDNDDATAEEDMRMICQKHPKLADMADRLTHFRQRLGRVSTGMSAAKAVQTMAFNIYEKGEILDFKTVYFTGLPNCKKVSGDLTADATNYGFDDDKGDYKIVPGDQLVYRYEIVGLLGKGSFGQVVKCIDHKCGKLVAVKIIRNKKRFHAQALVETKILQDLCEWDPEDKHHVVRVTHNFYFRGHLCIATELLSLNLYEFVKENEFKGLSIRIIRRFTKQILSCLCLLQRHHVIHCDLKPENILLVSPNSAEIKVIDFGSSCLESERVFTYIQSRFYRSPEVILGLPYGLPIDMWSLGCILAELAMGYPIFPGENEQEQLGCIMEIFGPPEPYIIESATRQKLFFDSNGKPRVVISSKGRRRIPNSRNISQVLRSSDDSFIDFVAACLRWDPKKRMKPDEAIRHPFITGKRLEKRTGISTISSIYNKSRVSNKPPTSSIPLVPTRVSQTSSRPLPEVPKHDFNAESATEAHQTRPAGARKLAPRKSLGPVGSVTTSNSSYSSPSARPLPTSISSGALSRSAASGAGAIGKSKVPELPTNRRLSINTKLTTTARAKIASMKSPKHLSLGQNDLTGTPSGGSNIPRAAFSSGNATAAPEDIYKIKPQPVKGVEHNRLL
ncbi:kinase-like domain-containing protein [Dipodascopsis uninucleata]